MNQREILFRGKRTDGRGWEHGDLIHNSLGVTHISAPSKWLPCEVDPDTVGQFTGLLDKKGKKIFSGDIVKVWLKKYESVCLPTFQHGIIEYVYDAYWIIPISRRASWRCLRNRPIEIIGNKWDNPELLEP